MSSDKSLSLDTSSASVDKTTTTTPKVVRIISHSNGTITGLLARKNRATSPQSAGEEQALEWHEVIELQTFSERKAWIEEKIKILERMPPIQVFVGLDAVRASAEEAPDLPTRAELQRWVEEHDRIEKETEIFDSGELRKLKKFTKAAAQRNLSPADTDLIELTLTTIYELDKLLHLLRDRSDSLELLSVRLTWEEKRISAWAELRSLMVDLRQFLHTRGRWSPAAYERNEDDVPPVVEVTAPIIPSLRRKGSMGSLASTASDSTISTLSFTRRERFKLAENLSRDAAQFASRVSSLRHSKITAAGKALDKLIDESRKPVPEVLLDEQDKLEDKGINEMEDVGKFVMGVVMQWKKADEIYVETLRDQSSAQTLVEEIEIAKLHHPSSRQDSTFLSRSSTLMKRLDMRETPASPNSFFPRPAHHLFPDQGEANESIVQTLASELAAAREQAQEVDHAAKGYHAALEAVRKVENACKAASEMTSTLDTLSQRLETGAESTAGDGSPPDLSSEACLHSQSHSVFLALFPALSEELSQAIETANKAVLSGRAAIADLPRTGIDTQFILDSAATIDRLATCQASLMGVRDTVSQRVETLNKCRNIWSAMATVFDELDGLRYDMAEAIQRQRHRQQASQDAALLTPESPTSPQVSTQLTVSEAETQLAALSLSMQDGVVGPLASDMPFIGSDLRTYLTNCSDGLTLSLEEIRRVASSWDSVQRQAMTMSVIGDETHVFQMRSEHLKLRYDDSIQEILVGTLSGQAVLYTKRQLDEAVALLKTDIQAFQDSLSIRVPFVGTAEMGSTRPSAPAVVRRRFSVSAGFSLDVVRQAVQAGSPFDAAALDRIVRADANSYSMLLAGEVESLTQKAELFQLAQLAQTIDEAVTSIIEDLQDASSSLETMQSSLSESSELVSLDDLSSISEQVDELYRNKGHDVASACISARDLLEQLEVGCARCDPSSEAMLSLPRRHAVEDVEEQFNTWREGVEVLSERVSDLQHLERVRLTELARAREEEEKRRLEVEARLERERLEREVQKRAEAERLLAQAKARAKAEAEARAAAERRLAEERARADEEAALAAALEAEQILAPTSDGAHQGDRHISIGGNQTKAENVYPVHETDVFGIVPPSSGMPPSENDSRLEARIVGLRMRLLFLGIHEIARPPARRGASLPTTEQAEKLEAQFNLIRDEADTLPDTTSHLPLLEAELRSLRTELGASAELLLHINALADLSASAQSCDLAFSDLLEHIDSYPAPPIGPLASPYVTDTSCPPEQQMSARLVFTQHLVGQVEAKSLKASPDPRAAAERQRIDQTWEELHAMATDRLSGHKSRPASVLSSGRHSRASLSSTPLPGPSNSSARKNRYGSISAAPPGSKFLAPPPPARRAASGASGPTHSRSSSRASMSSTSRSVSGPITVPMTNSRLLASTFASRQRANSVSSNSSPLAGPSVVGPSMHSGSVARPRARTGQSSHERVGSPMGTEVPRSQSRASLNAPRSSLSTSRSTWARAPRQSFPNLPKSPPPRKPANSERRPYVPNPKNKLDVAVGDVVNNLPMEINVEPVADTWKDQSGKYWIGDEDPKLCFCRILRSQTVMVRVGGGWTELSKFIKEHIADAFRLLPESPPRPGAREEKWISSATLAQSMGAADATSPPEPPRTPEPRLPYIPSFALSTPTGPSPRSIKTSSPGSPLHPLQFIRRADRDSITLRPDTPSKAPRAHAHPHTQRHPAWRP